MSNPISLPEGINEEELKKQFKEASEYFLSRLKPLKDPNTRDEAISKLTKDITDEFEYWLPPAFCDEARSEVEGEVGTLLSQIISYLLDEE